MYTKVQIIFSKKNSGGYSCCMAYGVGVQLFCQDVGWNVSSPKHSALVIILTTTLEVICLFLLITTSLMDPGIIPKSTEPAV